MKILLDECITKRLKTYLKEYETFTVHQLNLNGIKNGVLLKYCADNNFDVLLTIDKNLMFQQNLDRYSVTIVVLNSTTSKVEELITFLSSLKTQLNTLEKHRAYLIEK